MGVCAYLHVCAVFSRILISLRSACKACVAHFIFSHLLRNHKRRRRTSRQGRDVLRVCFTVSVANLQRACLPPPHPTPTHTHTHLVRGAMPPRKDGSVCCGSVTARAATTVEGDSPVALARYDEGYLVHKREGGKGARKITKHARASVLRSCGPMSTPVPDLDVPTHAGEWRRGTPALTHTRVK